MSNYVKVKIVSDGTATGTRVINAETGVPIPGVVGLRFEHNAGCLPLAYVQLLTFVEEANIVSDTRFVQPTVQ